MEYVYFAIIAGIIIIALGSTRKLGLKIGDKATLDLGEATDVRSKVAAAYQRGIDAQRRRQDIIEDTMRQQLKHSQATLDAAADEMCDRYATEVLVPLGVKSPKDTAHYELYRWRVRSFVGALLGILRETYDENHIAEKTEKEWSTHKHAVATRCMCAMRSRIDQDYSPIDGVTREEVDAFHERNSGLVQAPLMICLNNARYVAQQAHSKLQEIR